jgi:hypothetical protein
LTSSAWLGRSCTTRSSTTSPGCTAVFRASGCATHWRSRISPGKTAPPRSLPSERPGQAQPIDRVRPCQEVSPALIPPSMGRQPRRSCRSGVLPAWLGPDFGLVFAPSGSLPDAAATDWALGAASNRATWPTAPGLHVCAGYPPGGIGSPVRPAGIRWMQPQALANRGFLRRAKPGLGGHRDDAASVSSGRAISRFPWKR